MVASVASSIPIEGTLFVVDVNAVKNARNVSFASIGKNSSGIH